MTRPTILFRSLLVVMTLGLTAGPATAASTLTFVDGIYLTGLSADGTVATGNSMDGFYTACRWTAAGGVVNLGRSSGELLGRGGGIPGISADGERISSTIASDDTTVATQGRWTRGSGWEQTMPPLLPNGAIIDESIGTAYNISGDGETIVGLYWAEGARAYASSWTQAGGMVNLGSQAVTHDSRANGVNYDGTVVVGWSANPDSSLWMPTVWENGDLTVLTYTAGWCQAKAVNPDGNKIVGTTYDPATNILSAGMWMKADSLWTEFDLGFLPGTFQRGSGEVVACDLSADGAIVVGTNRFDGWNSAGFVWTAEKGIMLAKDYLGDFGITLSDSFLIREMTAVSEDGKTMAGFGYNRYVFPRINRSIIVTIDDASPVFDVPASTALDLGQPYPNPFTPSTSLALSIRQDSRIRLVICNARGHLIRTLHDGILTAGNHVMKWDGRMDNGRTAPSGLYLARIRDDDGHTQTRRLILVK